MIEVRGDGKDTQHEKGGDDSRCPCADEKCLHARLRNRLHAPLKVDAVGGKYDLIVLRHLTNDSTHLVFDGESKLLCELNLDFLMNIEGYGD